MIRSNDFAAGFAAAAMMLTLAAPVMAQQGGTPRQGQQPSLQEQQRAFEVQQQRQQAAADAQTRTMLERDVRVGNMTPAQQEALGQYAQNRIRDALSQAPSAVAGVQRNAEQFVDNTRTNLDRSSRALDPANSDSVSNREFGQAAASTGVDMVTDVNNMRLNNVRELRPVVLDLGAASADIMRERQRIIESNGNVSAEELQRVQGETQRVTRAAEALPTRLDEAEFRIRTETQRIRERETEIAQRIEQNAATYGRDPANVPPGAGGPRRYEVPPRAAAPPPPPPPEPATPPPASTPPSRAASSNNSNVRRGTIPGQGDPNAGLTVPRSQGGTGPETADSRAAAQAQAQASADAQARADAQSQAERNAARTEDLRQQAMDQARRDNEEIDSLSGAVNAAARVVADTLRAEAEAEAALESMNEMLRRAARPGQVGRGGGGAQGGSGFGGGSSDHEVFAALPGVGRDIPADLSDTELHAMIERSRVADENYRIFQSAARQNARDTAWDAMTRERFSNGAWDAFAGGATVTTLEFEQIYAGYDLDRSAVIPPMRSLSAAGTSLSSAGWSLSAAGTAVVTGFDDYNDPAVRSLYEATRVLTTPRRNPFAGAGTNNTMLADRAYSAGSFQVQTDRTGQRGRESGGYVAASLYTHDDPYLRQLMNNGRTGLDRLLAQPFNVILTWGAGAFDLDLHMTGPLGEGMSERFHIYFAAEGDLAGQPFAALIKDCVCNSGSEVILTSALNRGGVYRVSVFNYGDQSATSSNLSNASSAQIQIVRGGTTVSVGNGTTIVGGHTILTTTVPNGGVGNTWPAVELDPRNGRITVPRRISQSPGSEDVP